MSLAILFRFLCTQHFSEINISIIRSLRLFFWITTLVVLFSVRCVLEFRCSWVGVVSVLQAEAQLKWNKIASDIKLTFYSSTITMMHGPINIRFNYIHPFVENVFMNLQIGSPKLWTHCETDITLCQENV